MTEHYKWDDDALQASSDQVAHAIDYALRELPEGMQIPSLTIAVAKVMATYGARPGAAPVVIAIMARALVDFAVENSGPLEDLRVRFQAPIQ